LKIYYWIEVINYWRNHERKYEYKIEFFDAKEKGAFSSGVDMKRIERKLNDIGRLGWSLCEAIPEPGGMQYLILVFEREVSD